MLVRLAANAVWIREMHIVDVALFVVVKPWTMIVDYAVSAVMDNAKSSGRVARPCGVARWRLRDALAQTDRTEQNYARRTQ